MGHWSLGQSVHLSSVVGWDTVAWVRVSSLAGLLGGTLAWVSVRLGWTYGWDTGALVRVYTIAWWEIGALVKSVHLRLVLGGT